MLKCYRQRTRQPANDDAQYKEIADGRNKGLKKFIHSAENYLHNNSQYETDTTDNLGDAENPLHSIAQ